MSRVNKLIPSKSSVLPIGAVDYSRQYQDQLNNILRLYFNQVDINSSSLLTNTGGRFLGFPYGSFLDTTTQVAGSTTAAYAMRLNTTQYSNAITIASRTAEFTASINNGGVLAGTVLTVATIAVGSTIYLGMELTGVAAGTRVIAFVSGSGGLGTYTVSISQLVATKAMTGSLPSQMAVEFPGVYNLQFSAQLSNSSAADVDIDIWFRKNGTDIDNSNSIFTVPIKTGAVNGHTVAALNFFIELQNADYIEIMWHTASTSATIAYVGPAVTPTRPATPSIIAELNFVSSIPA